MENESTYILNKYEINGPTVICLTEEDNGWARCGEIMRLLTNYNFYITTDGCGNIFLHLEPADWTETGAEHYKWVSAEEDDYLTSVREQDDLTRAKEKAAEAE